MRHDVDTLGSAARRAANTAPNVEASQEKHGNSTTHDQNPTGRGEVSLEPCLRLLRRVLTRPDKKFD